MNLKKSATIATIVTTLIIGAYYAFIYYKAEELIFKDNGDISYSEKQSFPTEITITGTWTCIPNFTISETGKCAKGIVNKDRNFYLLLNLQKYSEEPIEGENITVWGTPGSTFKSKDGRMINTFLVKGIKETYKPNL